MGELLGINHSRELSKTTGSSRLWNGFCQLLHQFKICCPAPPSYRKTAICVSHIQTSLPWSRFVPRRCRIRRLVQGRVIVPVEGGCWINLLKPPHPIRTRVLRTLLVTRIDVAPPSLPSPSPPNRTLGVFTTTDQCTRKRRGMHKLFNIRCFHGGWFSVYIYNGEKERWWLDEEGEYDLRKWSLCSKHDAICCTW